MSTRADHGVFISDNAIELDIRSDHGVLHDDRIFYDAPLSYVDAAEQNASKYNGVIRVF